MSGVLLLLLLVSMLPNKIAPLETGESMVMVIVSRKLKIETELSSNSLSSSSGTCIAPLGMESGSIEDHQLSASSSFEHASVGPHNARFVITMILLMMRMLMMRMLMMRMVMMRMLMRMLMRMSTPLLDLIMPGNEQT